MKFLRNFLAVMVLALSFTFAAFAESPVEQEKSASVEVTKAEKAATAANDVPVFVAGHPVSNFTKNIAVAANTNSGTELNLTRNLSSENRNTYLNDKQAERPPDMNFAAMTDLVKPNEKQIPGFVTTAYIRRQ